MDKSTSRTFSKGKLSSAEIYDEMFSRSPEMPAPDVRPAPRLTSAEIRAQAVFARAQEIIDADAEARAAKTARLRAARLEAQTHKPA